MTERLIVVGGLAAGMSAAAKARRINQNLEMVVYIPILPTAGCSILDGVSLSKSTPERSRFAVISSSRLFSLTWRERHALFRACPIEHCCA